MFGLGGTLNQACASLHAQLLALDVFFTWRCNLGVANKMEANHNALEDCSQCPPPLQPFSLETTAITPFFEIDIGKHTNFWTWIMKVHLFCNVYFSLL